jgi:hypothetical protein
MHSNIFRIQNLFVFAYNRVKIRKFAVVVAA